jgi:hypothetical protein
MKKFIAFLLALAVMGGQAYAAVAVTRSVEERIDDAATGDSYRRVTGYLALDNSHPAEGEVILPSQFGMASFTRFSADASGPAAWTAQSVLATARNVRRFGFDYTANRLYVISTISTASSYGEYEVSGPITYDLAYLTKVPFEAVGPIS